MNDLLQRAFKVVFDERLGAEDLDGVVAAFDQGWQVEVGPSLPSGDYLGGLDEIPGLRQVVERLVGGKSPALLASGIEFVLEGLHLSNRLNKTVSDVSQYTRREQA